MPTDVVVATVVVDVDSGDTIVELAGGAPIGPAGVPGTGTGDKHYVHSQGIAATTWNVVHNLGKLPAIQVFDSANTQVEAAVVYIDINSLTVVMTAAMSGKAVCN